MVLVCHRETEISEAPSSFLSPSQAGASEIKQEIKSQISFTSCLTFSVLLENKLLWILKNRELLIASVKQKAKSLGLNPDTIKSETITRTYRKMVEAKIIIKDPVSQISEEANREFWGRC